MAAHGLLFPAAYRPTFCPPRKAALIGNRPAETDKNCVFPCKAAPHKAACPVKGPPCAWRHVHGCPWRDDGFSPFLSDGDAFSGKKAKRSENKEFPRVGTRCNAQRLSPLNNKDSRLRGARGSGATPARGKKHASPREPSPTYARKSCLRRSFFPAQCRALHELSSHNGRTQRSRLRFRKNAVSLPKT